MLFFQTSIGVHIDNDYVSAVLLGTSFKGIVKKDCKVQYFAESTSFDEKLKIVSCMTSDFVRNYGISSPYIHIGIPLGSVILRDITLPSAVKENLRTTVKYELEKYVPLSGEDLYFDIQNIAEDKEEKRIRVLLAAVKKDELKPYFDLIDLTGHGLASIDISLAAAVNTLAGLFPSLKCYAFVWLKNDRFEIGFVQDGFLNVSRVFKTSLKGPELLSEIGRELQTVQDNLPDKSEGQKQNENLRVVLWGTLVDENLEEGVREKGFDLVNLNLYASPVSAQEFISPYGLALKGLKKVSNNFNFLPVNLRKRSSKAPLYAVIALCLLAVLSAMSWQGSLIVRTRSISSHLDKEISILQKDAKQIDKIRKEYELLEQKIGYMKNGNPGKAFVLDIIKELSCIIPYGSWVSDLRFSDKGISIIGFAERASELIPLLDKSPYFEDVIFTSSITKTRAGKERFKIALKVLTAKNAE